MRDGGCDQLHVWALMTVVVVLVFSSVLRKCEVIPLDPGLSETQLCVSGNQRDSWFLRGYYKVFPRFLPGSCKVPMGFCEVPTMFFYGSYEVPLRFL